MPKMSFNKHLNGGNAYEQDPNWKSNTFNPTQQERQQLSKEAKREMVWHIFLQEIERMMHAFAGELCKLDETLDVLSAYVRRMRTSSSSRSGARPGTCARRAATSRRGMARAARRAPRASCAAMARRCGAR